MVLLGIAGRLLNFHVPGTDAYAGYCMAACGLSRARAHAQARRAHPRHADPRARSARRRARALELWSLAVASAARRAVRVSTASRLAFQSWQFNDISTGNDATPLWIPQLAMAAGTLVLAIAFVDELVLEWPGGARARDAAEALHHE